MWSSERDGAERVRNVEHIRGLVRADSAETWMLQQSITVDARNPWDSFAAHGAWPNRVAGHDVGLRRVNLDNPSISEVPIEVDPTVPASEVQGMAETLRRHYQSETTAETLDQRDRSLQMPPRTVGDANPQLTGWLAQVAQSNGKLTLDPPPLPTTNPTTTNAANVAPDLLRRADSGKFDHGGAEQTKALANAYKGDPVPEATNTAFAGGQFAVADDVLKPRIAGLFREFMSLKPQLAFAEGLYQGFVKDGFIGTLEGIGDLSGFVFEKLNNPEVQKEILENAILGPLAPFVRGMRTIPRAVAYTKKLSAAEVIEKLKKAGSAAAAAFSFVTAVELDLFKIPIQHWATILTGNADSPSLDLSPETQLVLSVIGEPLGRLADYVKDKMTATEAAGLLGRVIGNIAYEVAEGFLTEGAATAVKAAARSAKVAKLARRIQKVADVLEEIPALKGSPKIREILSDLLFAVKYVLTSSMCFVAGTKIHTLNGLKSIEEIQPGDLVLSRSESDPDDRRPHYKPVLSKFVTHPTELLHVEFVTDTGAVEMLSVTRVHPFFEQNRRAFVPAENLRVGDQLARPEGGTATVRSVRMERAAEGERFTTYNFEVADFHTYFVGDSGIWVHNTGNPCLEAANHYRKVANAVDGVPIPIGTACAAAKETGEWLVDLMVNRVLKNEKSYSPLQFKNHLKDFVDDLARDGLNDVDRARVSKQMYDKFVSRVEGLRTAGAKEKARDINRLLSDGWKDFFEEKIKRGADDKPFVSKRTFNTNYPNSQGALNHTHHIIMKNGTIETAQLVDDAQELLVEFGIDPIFGKQNLICAPNFHLAPWTKEGQEQYRKYAQAGFDRLKAIKDGPGTLAQKKDRAEKALLKLAKDWTKGDFLPKR